MKATNNQSRLSVQVFWTIGLLFLGMGTALAQSPAGQIMVATGSVKAIDAQGRERVLEKGGEVRPGDRIVTGDNGLAQVRMADGGYLSIRAGTEMTLDAFHHDERNQNNSSVLMSIVKGGFRSITGLIGRANPGAYKITTGTATIGIRGTDHEPMVIPPGPPNIPVINAPGVYDKVNDGETFIQNERGILSLKPGQIGFAPTKPDLPPAVVLKVPDFYRETVKTDARDPKDATQRKQDDKGSADRRAGGQLRPGFSEQRADKDDAPAGSTRTAAGDTAPRLPPPPSGTTVDRPPPTGTRTDSLPPPPTTTYVPLPTDPLRTTTTALPPPPTMTYVPPPTDPLRTTTTILPPPPPPPTTTTTTILPPPPTTTTTTTTIIR